MKKEEIDQLIKESLSKEDARFYHDLDEQGMFKQWGSIYKSKLGAWAVFISAMQLIFTVLIFWTGYRFLTADGMEPLIKWGAGLFLSFIVVAQLKLWHWMQMDKNTILLEMKRLEFQVAVLTEKISGKKKK